MRLFKMQITILLQAVICGIVVADLPKYITKCQPGDGDCLVTLFNKIIKMFPKGNPEIGLIPINAISYGSYFIVKLQNAKSFEYNLRVVNQTIFGFENTTITQVEGFKKDPHSSNFEIYGRVPRLLVTGHYDLKVKFWFFTSYLNGPFKIEFLDLQFAIKLKVIQLFRNNKTYLEVYDVISTFDMDRFLLSLENLVPDNSDLEHVVNQAISENWREVYNELEEPVIKVFSGQIKDMINNMTRILSYDDILQQ